MRGLRGTRRRVRQTALQSLIVAVVAWRSVVATSVRFGIVGDDPLEHALIGADVELEQIVAGSFDS